MNAPTKANKERMEIIKTFISNFDEGNLPSFGEPLAALSPQCQNKIRMSFKENKPSIFKPALDPFRGRGKQGGLTHGGQYSVDYILAEDAKKNKAKITAFFERTHHPLLRLYLQNKRRHG